MQKKLIALAVAGLVSAPVFAQSNVTIYGIADAFIAVGDQGDADINAVQSGGLSGSRLGFRGTEDLGNGLKAVFTYEQGYNVDDGTGLGGNSRQSFVGLAGNFGSVTLGRQYAPGFDYQKDALASSQISPQALLSSAAGSTIQPGGNARWSNSIAYNGEFGAVKARAIYSLRAVEVGDDPADDDAFGLGLDYNNGGLGLAAVYQHVNREVGDDQKEWFLGASYNFGVATLAGSYQHGEGTSLGTDFDLWQLGVIVPVGNGNIHAAYGLLDGDNGGESESFALAYTHALSKRTTAYAGYNHVENDGLGTPVLAGAANAAFANEDGDLFVVGLRHVF